MLGTNAAVNRRMAMEYVNIWGLVWREGELEELERYKRLVLQFFAA